MSKMSCGLPSGTWRAIHVLAARASLTWPECIISSETINIVVISPARIANYIAIRFREFVILFA
jgi:hypothetical protein